MVYDWMKHLENLNFTNTFICLSPELYQAKSPDPVTEPYLIDFNAQAAKLIGLNPAESERQEFAEYFSGNKLLRGF